MIREAIAQIVRGEDLREEQMMTVMTEGWREPRRPPRSPPS
jgi:hypothetical protein